MKKNIYFLFICIFLFSACSDLFNKTKENTNLEQFVKDFKTYTESEENLKILNGLYFIENNDYQFYSLDLLKSYEEKDLQNLEEKISTLNSYAYLVISEKITLLTNYSEKEDFFNSANNYLSILNEYTPVYNISNDNIQILNGETITKLSSDSFEGTVFSGEVKWFYFEDASNAYNITGPHFFIYDNNMNYIDDFKSYEYYHYSPLKNSKVYIKIPSSDYSPSTDYTISCTKGNDTDYDNLELNTSVNNEISEYFEIDGYSLEVEADKRYTFYINKSSDFNGSFSVYDADHHLIKYDYSTFSFIAPGSTIYIDVNGSRYYNTGNYSISINEHTNDDLELNYNEWLEGNIDYSDEEDWYYFEAEENKEYTVYWSNSINDLYNSPSSASEIQVYSEDKSTLITSTKTDSYINFTSPVTGKIYMKVSNLSTGTYYLKYGNSEFSNEIKLESSTWYEGNIDYSYERDWYYFDVIKGEIYTFFYSDLSNNTYESSNVDTYIDLYYSNKEDIFIKDPNSIHSFIAKSTGRLYIKVNAKNYSNSGNYFVKIESYNGPYTNNIELETEYYDKLIFADQVKLYSFDAIEGQNYIIKYIDLTIKNHSYNYAHINIDIYNEDMTELLASTSDNKLLSFTASNSEKINIKVTPYSNESLGSFYIECREHNTEAVKLTEDYRYTGEIFSAYDENWFYFEIEEYQPYTIYLSDYRVDVYFDVYNEDKSEILLSNVNEYSTTYYPSYIGKFFIKVKSFDPYEIGNYDIKYIAN